MLSYRPARRTASSLLNPCPAGGLRTPGGRDEVRQPEGLRPVALDGRAPDEARRVRTGTADRGGPDRLAVGWNGEQAMGPEQPPTDVGRTREPLPKGRANPGELGRAAGHGDHGEAKSTVESVQVEHVESPDHGSVQENGPDALDSTDGTDERYHATGAVRAVHADASGADRLDVLGEGERDRGERSVPIPPRKRAVIDPDHSRMRLTEGPPQR